MGASSFSWGASSFLCTVIMKIITVQRKDEEISLRKVKIHK
jgi:hypothetical protein